MNEQIKAIAEKLIEKTDKGRVIWNKSSADCVYVILPQGGIGVSILLEASRGEIYGIDVYDNTGNHIYRKLVEKRENKESHKLLQELYLAARGAYHNASEVYESMLREMESSDIIGKKQNNND
jgi:hypothetical protein